MNPLLAAADTIPRVPRRSRHSLPGFIVVAVITLVMANLCRAEFTWWDDWGTIHQNGWLNPPTLASLRHYWTSVAFGLYIPVTYTVWIILAVVARLNQSDPNHISLNPWIFHSANVLVHIVTCWAVYRVLRRIVGDDWSACVGALLFAVHPVQVESVGWASGLKDLLAGCFGVLALWRYIALAQRDKSATLDPLGLLALLAAIGSKPSAAMVPLIAIIIDRLIIGRPMRTVLRSAATWLMVMIGALIGARLAQSVEGLPAAPLWTRPFIAGDTVTFYLRQLIYPIPLGIDYGRRPSIVIEHWWTYVEWIVPAILLLAFWQFRRERPWMIAAALVLLAAILPVSGLSTFEFQYTSTTADHYLYTAMLGVAIGGAFVFQTYQRSSRSVAIASASVILALLSARSVMQTFTWLDDFSLFENALEVNPHSFVAHNNLGHAYDRLSDDSSAAEEFSEAIADNPSYPDAYGNLASEQLRTGDLDGAVKNLRKMIELRAALPPANNPTAATDHAKLAELLLLQNHPAEAKAELETAKRISPGDDEVKIAIERMKQFDSTGR